MPLLFVGHGAAVFTANPSDPTHRALLEFASTLASWRPRAVLIVSAHFESQPVAITGPGPLATIHDHPARAHYDYRYPGHGEAWLSELVLASLQAAAIPAAIVEGRGLDHGAWIPLSCLRPTGDLPVAQISLQADRSWASHRALGLALAGLRAAGVVIVASGGATHNQAVFREGYFAGRELGHAEPFSLEFEQAVDDALTQHRGDERLDRLEALATRPLAALAHPTIEHLLPLVVAAAAAGDDPARRGFRHFQHSLATSAWQFGGLDGPTQPDLGLVGPPSSR